MNECKHGKSYKEYCDRCNEEMNPSLSGLIERLFEEWPLATIRKAETGEYVVDYNHASKDHGEINTSLLSAIKSALK